MFYLRLLILVLCGLLVACSDTNNADTNQEIPDVIPADIPPIPSEIEIQETALPIIEHFGADDSVAFFNPAYKPLQTDASHQLSDGTTLVDTLPSFYYPTCCFFQTDDITGEQLRDPPQYTSDLNFRLRIGQNKMAISNARFSIGQILSDLTPENVVDRKVNTTNGAIALLGSWGELDLSRPYRMSFCLVDAAGSSNLEVYADNNSGGNQAQSIHGALSLLLRTPVTGGPVPLIPGNRIVIEVPGNVFQVDDNGDQVGDILGVASSLQVGRSRSFFQIRVSSGGHAVISDLVIERQNQNNAAGMSCDADPGFWIAPPPATPTGLLVSAGTGEINVSWNVAATAISYDVLYNTLDSTTAGSPQVVNIPAPASGTTVSTTLTGLTNGTPYYVFVRANNAGGSSAYTSPGASATPQAVIPPPGTPTGLTLITVSEQINASWTPADANASSYDVAINTINDPDVADGATVVNVVATQAVLPGLTNGNSYYVFVRAKNSAGDSAYTAGVEANPPGIGEDRIWGFILSSYQAVSGFFPSFAAGATNSISVDPGPREIDGLNFFFDQGSVLRYRDPANDFNFNGTAFANSAVDPTVPANGETADTLRAYLGFPVEAGRPLIFSVMYRQTGSAGQVGILALLDQSNVVLDSVAVTDTDFGLPFEYSLAAGHSVTEIRIIYSREGADSGGMDIDQVVRNYGDDGSDPTPDAPAAPSLTAGDAQIEVSWTGVSGATGYDILYNTENSTSTGSPVLFSGNPVSGTNATITGLTNGVEYFVFVRGENAAGDGDYSPGTSATPAAPTVVPDPPEAPDLTAGDEEIGVSWTAVSGATAYDILYNTQDSTSTGSPQLFSGNPVSGTSATITGLTNDTEYFVFVRAKNSAGDSAYSPSASATPTAPPVAETFNGLPLNVDFSVGRDEFFAGQGQGGTPVPPFGTPATDPPYQPVGDFLAISDDADNPFYKIFGSASRIHINGDGNLFFGNAFWAAGSVSHTATSAITAPNGDMDLSTPYKITIQIESVPTFPSGTNGFQVLVDNNTSGAANSIHGTASRFMNLRTGGGLAVGELVINVPGDITMNGSVVGNVPVHRGTENSFLTFRCPSECGDPNAATPDGIEISGIAVEYLPFGAPPAPPNTPVLTPGDQQIGVSWFPVGGATGYDVAYNTVDDSATATPFGGNPVGGASATITGLVNGTAYFVFVRSKNAAGDSAYSSSATATPVGPPAAPAAPSLTPGDTQIGVSWTGVSSATGYDILYNTVDSTTNGSPQMYSGNPVSGTGATLSGLSNGTEYFVFVRAKNAAGNGDYSPGSSATPVEPVVVPDPPEAPDLTAGDEEIEVEWTAVSGALSYDILYNTEDSTTNGSPQMYSGNPVSGTGAILTGLSNGTEYFIFVRATNSAGDSDYSPGASATPVAPAGGSFSGLPLNVEFGMSRNEFFGGQYNQAPDVPFTPVGTFLGVSDDATNPFYKVYSSGNRIRMAGTPGIRFANAAWTAGDRRGNTGATTGTPPLPAGVNTSAGVLPQGDMDLSLPFTITIQIAALPAAAGQFQVFVDNNTTGSANSVHRGASRLVQLTAADGLAVGTLVINVPGAVTMNGTPVAAAAIANHVGTANSFLAFRCPSNCGAIEEIAVTQTDATANAPTVGIAISSIEVEYQPGGVLQPPLAPAAPLLTPADSEIGVTWNIMGNTTAYDVAYNTINDPDEADGATVVNVPSGNSTTLTGLVNGVTYFVFVRAKNAAGDSPYGPNASAAPAGPPDAPAAPSLTAGDMQIEVDWTGVSGATGYDILYNTEDSTTTGSPQLFGGNPVAGTNATITGLMNDVEYFVFVRAKNALGDSDYSPSASATPEAPVIIPDPPAVPVLTAGDEEIEVSWTAVSGATGGYDILYNTEDSTVTGSPQMYSGNPVSGTGATITGLSNGTEYWVFVRAKNSAGDSDYSPGASATPEDTLLPPDTPINLNATVGDTELGVSWDPAPTGAAATAYDVAYNTIDDPDVEDGATVIADIGTGATTITGLANGTTYYVFVRAKNVAGTSAYSASDPATPAGGPNAADRTWTGTPDMAEATYASILASTPPTANNNVAAGTDTTVNGLHFFASSAGPLRHRSTVNEFNYNGSSYTSDVTTPAVGNAAPATRAYIAVPVDAGRPVTVTAVHRNSSSGVTANSVKIVFIGSDGNVLCAGNAASNTATTTPCALSGGHSQTEVRVIYSREGTAVGGQHLTTLTRDYQDN